MLGAGRGPLRHAFAGAAHLAAHPRPARFSGRDTALAPLDLAAERLGVATPADFAWNRLAAFDACIQCGRCETACPAYAAGQPLNPKKLIQDLALAFDDLALAFDAGTDAAYAGHGHPGRPIGVARGGLDAPVVGDRAMIHPDTLWSCTTCRACVEACPMMIEHVDAVVDLRRHQTLEHGALPRAAADALENLRATDTVRGRAVADRLDFAADLGLRVLAEGEAAEVLLWLGEGAFELRAQRSLRALLALLRRAGVDVAVLGAEERDCGDLARRLGDEATFQALARANIATLARRSFARIVSADPHVVHALGREYQTAYSYASAPMTALVSLRWTPQL